MASKTFINGGVNLNWNTAGNWSPVASVPAAGDDVIFNASSPNCSVNVVTNNLNSLDMTGFTGTLACGSKDKVVIVGTASTTTNVILAGTLNSGGNGVDLVPTSGATLNLDASGVVGNISCFITLEGAGTVSLQSNISIVAGVAFNMKSTCTVNTNGFTINSGLVQIATGNTFNFANSAINLNGSSGTLWSVTGTPTITSTGSTISFLDTSSSGKTFAGGGLIYNNVSISGGGTGAIVFTGANTFSKWPQVTGGTKTLTWPSGVTTTIVDGTAGLGNGTNVITFTSSTPTSAYTHTTAGGTVSCDYLNLTDATAAGTVPFYAGAHSTGSNTTNWTFTAPPSPPPPVPKTVSTGKLPSRRMVGVGL